MSYETELAERRRILAAKHKEMAAKFREVGRLLDLKEVYENQRSDANAWDAAVVSFYMGTKGASMFLRYDAEYGDGRVHIRGVYPRDAKGQYIEVYDTTPGKFEKVYGPDIMVSPEKTAEQIAGDIRRRFMSPYIEHLAWVMEQVNASNDYEATTAGALLALIDAKTLTEYEKNAHAVSIEAGKLPEQEYDARIHVKASRHDLTLELSNIDLTTARAIIGLIKTRAKTNTEKGKK